MIYMCGPARGHPGCYAFDIAINGVDLKKLWIRAGCLEIYNYVGGDIYRCAEDQKTVRSSTQYADRTDG